MERNLKRDWLTTVLLATIPVTAAALLVPSNQPFVTRILEALAVLSYALVIWILDAAVLHGKTHPEHYTGIVNHLVRGILTFCLWVALLWLNRNWIDLESWKAWAGLVFAVIFTLGIAWFVLKNHRKLFVESHVQESDLRDKVTELERKLSNPVPHLGQDAGNSANISNHEVLI
jgi:peptidoglycan biosynthesis protein MviN/MurJ (putative lipid II flippase)